MKSNEQLKQELSAPLPQCAVKPHPTKSYLSTIKAIYVTERLSDVFGIGKWSLKTQEIKVQDNGMIVVKVILEVPDYGIYYESFGGNDNGGGSSKNFDLGDAYKGATTDGITKIGSYLGIAIDVFKDIPNKPETPEKQAPSYTPEIAQEIYNCTTKEQLRNVWNKYPQLKENSLYKNDMTNRGIEL